MRERHGQFRRAVAEGGPASLPKLTARESAEPLIFQATSGSLIALGQVVIGFQLLQLLPQPPAPWKTAGLPSGRSG